MKTGKETPGGGLGEEDAKGIKSIPLPEYTVEVSKRYEFCYLG